MFLYVVFVLYVHLFSMDLKVSFFSTKYMNHAAGCPSLPHQMKLHFCSMDELPCYWDGDLPYGHDDEDDFDSNDNQESANCSDELIESSSDGSMEMNPSSIHVESCNIQKSSDNLSVEDCIAFGGPLESESLPVAGVLEEHMQPLHDYQLPVDDVCGSPVDTLNKQFQPCEEICIEDFRGYFPVSEENIHPVGRYHASEKELSPVVEENQLSSHLPADVPASTGNNLSEVLRIGKNTGAEKLRCCFPKIDNHIQSLEEAGPSEMVDCASVAEDTGKKDNATCVVINDITEEQFKPIRLQSPIRFTNTSRPYSDEGIEVIELCTPSPNLRICKGSKKKRAASNYPHFIDLTESPSVVQL